LTDPSFLEDPYPVYRRMRERDPVDWSDALGSWVLTRYDDVLAATRHPALSSARTEVFVRAQLPYPEEGGGIPAPRLGRPGGFRRGPRVRRRRSVAGVSAAE
jgi:cytochrome P450